MFSFRRCSVPSCGDYAVTGAERCAQHSESREELSRQAAGLLVGASEHEQLNMSGLAFEGLNLAGHRFYSCRFTRSVLRGVDLTGASLRLCFLDFATVDGCRCIDSNIMYSVFAGARIEHGDFSGSDVLHTNLDGVGCSDTTFNDSDLYFSRFINARLRNVSFVDCNLKRVFFTSAELTRVNFKYSNYEEAIFGEDPILS